MIRLYINSFDADKLWSTDSGPGTEESQWDEVIVFAPGRTNQNLAKRGSKIEPCCWIEFETGKIRIVPPEGSYERRAVIEW